MRVYRYRTWLRGRDYDDKTIQHERRRPPRPPSGTLLGQRARSNPRSDRADPMVVAIENIKEYDHNPRREPIGLRSHQGIHPAKGLHRRAAHHPPPGRG